MFVIFYQINTLIISLFNFKKYDLNSHLSRHSIITKMQNLIIFWLVFIIKTILFRKFVLNLTERGLKYLDKK